MKGDALAAADWQNLSTRIRAPQAVLLDRANGTVMYVLSPSAGQAQRIVIAPSYFTRNKTLTANMRTAYWSNLDDLRRETRGGNLELLEGSLDD